MSLKFRLFCSMLGFWLAVVWFFSALFTKHSISWMAVLFVIINFILWQLIKDEIRRNRGED